MGIIKAIADSASGTFADQWKDIYTAGNFDEHTVVSPGVLKNTNRGRGTNTKGSEGVISNGSVIFVPENTAAFIFSHSGVENIITESGKYEYRNGEDSVFSGSGITDAIFQQVGKRVGFGGQSDSYTQIAYVNLREIRNITFGTKGPQLYHDSYYGCDLEIYAYGTFTIQVVDAYKFIANFVPPNTLYYSFDEQSVRNQVVSDFLQSFIVSLNTLSRTHRISDIPSQANRIEKEILMDEDEARDWEDRFGFKLVHVSIENIELSDSSRKRINQFNKNRMDVKAYENISREASDMAAQQKVAKGVQENGFGDAGGMIFGMNMAQSFAENTGKKESSAAPKMSLDEQIEALKKLKDLVDMGILTDEEFNLKKKEIMGL